MESRWPEHTPEPDEPPPWRGWAIGIAAIAAIAFLLPRDANWFGTWHAPSLPEIAMPEINMPDLDLRGRDDGAQTEPPPATANAEESLAAINDALGENGTAQPMAFETCLNAIGETARALNAAPAIIEDGAEHRVARFKLVQGNLTVTCSDGTMRLEQSN